MERPKYVQNVSVVSKASANVLKRKSYGFPEDAEIPRILFPRVYHERRLIVSQEPRL